MHSKPSLTIVVLALIVTLTPSTLSADACTEHWTDPVACTVDVTLEREEERDRVLEEEATVRVRPGEHFELLMTARDQEGDRFPSERMLYRWEADRDCRGLVSLEEHGHSSHVTAEAGPRPGSCDLRVWVPGNLNLDRRIRIEIAEPTDLRSLARSHPEEIARAMYRGILGRSPDSRGLRNATEEIRQGEIEQEVRKMCGSREYAKRSRGLRPEGRLDDLYRGLLGRDRGRGGDRYLVRLERGECAEAVLGIMRSPEFERRITGAEDEDYETHHH
ncbi:MAG: hypothetical protein R3234_09625 [Thermoanaerobaculia bacterium]|nr:hypothetical protein [Thermoanaerobaculia bacterium]